MVGGALLALCFEPFNLPDLVWVAPACWMAAVWLGAGEKRPKRKGFLIGLCAGVIFWMINIKWLISVVGAAYLILVVYLALFFAFFGLFISTVGNPFRTQKESLSRMEVAFRSLGFAALNAGLWCGLEWLRGLLFTGFGWNGLGVAFNDRLALAQGAELVGVTGLAFLPIFIAGVMVQVGVRLMKSVKSGRMERHWDFMAAVLILILAFSYGILRMTMVNRADGDDLRVLLVQQNIPQVAGDVSWTDLEIHGGYEDETAKALAEVDAENERLMAEAEGEVELKLVDWVVWPEVVLRGPLLNDGGDHSVLLEPSEGTLRKIRSEGVRTFVGGVMETQAQRGNNGVWRTMEGAPFYNSMIAIDPAGELAVHRKQHLVIYGEFIPFVDSVKWLGDIYETVAGVPWAGNLGRGTGSDGFVLPGAGGEVQVIPTVCFEDTVPRVVRKFSKGEREVIVNITNDGWFGESEGSRQHFDNALFRCIELRRPMMRAANRGVTGIVSATGSLVNYETGERQVLEDENGLPFLAGHVYGTARIMEKGGPTLYARAGDWFAVTGLLVALGFGISRRRAQKRK